MGLRGILLYTLRAGAFAVAVTGIYVLICRLCGRRPGWVRLLAVAYVAALIQITVLRGGVDWQGLGSARPFPQLIPLKTTIEEARAGLWPLIYHSVGNLIWFVPLGLLLGRGGLLRAMAIGAALSIGIEIMQYLLMTGMTDIDDVILNALGSGMGWTIQRHIKQRHKKHGFE